mmetsp:Transcript_2824/g.5983  ORF Transcript_2824/g.5983 Transcript_2824/m.5983 type:complete len:479 (-) Transcript_2824:29-1465(-)
MPRPYIDGHSPKPMPRQQPENAPENRKRAAPADGDVAVRKLTPNAVPRHPHGQDGAHPQPVAQTELGPIHEQPVPLLRQHLGLGLSDVPVAEPFGIYFFHFGSECFSLLPIVAIFPFECPLVFWESFIKLLRNLHKSCVVHYAKVVQQLGRTVNVPDRTFDGIRVAHEQFLLLLAVRLAPQVASRLLVIQVQRCRELQFHIGNCAMPPVRTFVRSRMRIPMQHELEPLCNRIHDAPPPRLFLFFYNRVGRADALHEDLHPLRYFMCLIVIKSFHFRHLLFVGSYEQIQFVIGIVVRFKQQLSIVGESEVGKEIGPTLRFILQPSAAAFAQQRRGVRGRGVGRGTALVGYLQRMTRAEFQRFVPPLVPRVPFALARRIALAAGRAVPETRPGPIDSLLHNPSRHAGGHPIDQLVAMLGGGLGTLQDRLQLFVVDVFGGPFVDLVVLELQSELDHFVGEEGPGPTALLVLASSRVRRRRR